MPHVPLLRTARLAAVACLLASCNAVGPFDPAALQPIPPFAVPPPRDGVTYCRALVIGDMGTGGPGQHAVARAMALRAAAEPVDFVLTVGDNIYSSGVSAVDDPLWRGRFEDVYDAPALQVPFYATLGNHDHQGSVQAQIDYSMVSARWRMPAAYYTFSIDLGDGASVQFFALDTHPINQQWPEVATQLAWLDDTLAASAADWKIAFGHHPLYGHNPDRGHNPRLIAALEPVFVRHGLDLYLAGHDHVLDMLKPVRGVHYAVSGAASGTDRPYHVDWTDESYYAATNGGFVALRLSAEELVIEFVRLDGRTQYAHVIPRNVISGDSRPFSGYAVKR